MSAQSTDTPEVRELLKTIYSALFVSDNAVGVANFLARETTEDLGLESDFDRQNVVEILTACTKRNNTLALEAMSELQELLGIKDPLFKPGEAFRMVKEAEPRLPAGWMDEAIAWSQQRTTKAPETAEDARGKPKLDTRRDGALFACELLDEMQRTPRGDECFCCDSDYTKKQANNILLHYVTELQERGTAEALGGFCAVLTDDLGQYAAAEAPSHGDLFRGIINRGNLAA